MVFAPDGKLTFENGLDFFNPAEWTLKADRNELTIRMPQTPDEPLQIFQLYVGDGVKALDRARQEVTYAFTPETWNLNVAGWTYTKSSTLPVHSEEEPVLK